MELLLVVAVAAAFILLVKHTKAKGRIAELTLNLKARQNEIEALEREVVRLHGDLQVQLQELQRFKPIQDVEAEAKRLRVEAQAQRDDLVQGARNRLEKAEEKLQSAVAEADRIVAVANERAQEIAGDAFAAMGKAKELTEAAQAMKNIIEGYGDAYIVPTYNLLDDLAEEFGFTEAGKELKQARESCRLMVKLGRSATCDYVEANRREIAIRFVTDAFNGKVDSILSRTKTDNHGKLEQEIRDAFALVNLNGSPFRNARITEEYLKARLEELKWAVTARALKEREREEQRQLREQMREEEKARREYERAIKEAAKEESTLRKAMEKAQQQVAAANEAQRAEFEARLAALQEQLKAAEEKNQRALSMAQQTRAGHVYVISNIGSFGEEVFKIGMTRRLEPLDRIRELGDASVPFEFDVHAMIFSDDAPGLEKQLHRHFLRQQINKVNPRKEFFRLELAEIRQELETLGVETHWTMSALAHEFRETLRIEQQIRDNPAIAAEWTRHQIEVEAALDMMEEEEVMS
ncbi:MAG: DUF4041 domain-containing protein [Pseudomonas stutzeri]|nr:DUF4041 domain-containing protein [Stutzerimonas stutzeri]NIM55660.1 DUF4041 domain-containing protein [Stutzerimonas stutzeri]NIM87097.1 DUF4041 domain-containing protein [Stutzerimonas stutzeri]NIN81757.1 DUF4041 domain-containing protein [Stutzerimonas stutzeri]NIP01004.1 DUF4041 domain-containing protein [Stutzerimonas stutzeri]